MASTSATRPDFFPTLALAQRFAFSKDKLQVVSVLNPRIVDKENAFQLYQDFPFNNDKEQLKQILGR
ncbi:MAG: DUF4476 domain-containing protein [Myxococcaceae bacterium]